MKTTTSSLNPHAVSYVPLAKREVQNVDKECGEAAVPDTYTGVDDLKLKGHQADAAHSTQAEIPQVMDEEAEMDLAYLQMIFPGVSDQSLADVYNVNKGDLEAAVEMLSELESADDQPDASNINNTLEPVSAGECSSMKAVMAAAGESSASSGSSGVAVANS